jgi:hypothetical protein
MSVSVGVLNGRVVEVVVGVEVNGVSWSPVGVARAVQGVAVGLVEETSFDLLQAILVISMRIKAAMTRFKTSISNIGISNQEN